MGSTCDSAPTPRWPRPVLLGVLIAPSGIWVVACGQPSNMPAMIQEQPTPSAVAGVGAGEAPAGKHTDQGDASGTGDAAPADEIGDGADREQVRRMQMTDISILDSELAGQTFSEWLHDLAGSDGRVSWETNDCGEGGDGRESPTCVEADVQWRPCGTLAIAFGVSDSRGKAVGALASWGVTVRGIGVGVELKSLHEIPEGLRQARALDAALHTYPEHRLTPDEAFEAAKRLDMRVLDQRARSGSFGEWIEALAGPRRPVRWRATGCTGGPRELYLRDSCDDSWACAEAEFEDDREVVSVSIRLGTVRRGVIGKPSIDQVSHWAKGLRDPASTPNLHPQLHDLLTELIPMSRLVK